MLNLIITKSVQNNENNYRSKSESRKGATSLHAFSGVHCTASVHPQLCATNNCTNKMTFLATQIFTKPRHSRSSTAVIIHPPSVFYIFLLFTFSCDYASLSARQSVGPSAPSYFRTTNLLPVFRMLTRTFLRVYVRPSVCRSHTI